MKLLGPTPMSKFFGDLTLSAAICQALEKGRKMGELGLPGRMLKMATTRAATIRAELTRKYNFSVRLVLVMPKRMPMIRLGIRKTMRLVAEPAGLINCSPSDWPKAA